jgi:hypothetical protein
MAEEERRTPEPRPPSRVTVVALGVLGSLIATILYSIFYTPIMNGTSYVTDTIMSPFYSGYIDSPYRQAALGYANAYFYLISQVAAYIIFGFLGFIVASAINIMTERRTPTQRGNIVDRMLAKKIIYKKIIPSSMIFFIIVVLMSISYMQNLAFNSMQAAVTLDNRLKILAPYITDTDQKILISEWAKMRTRHDYEQIISKLDHIAKDHDVTLPQPLI